MNAMENGGEQPPRGLPRLKFTIKRGIYMLPSLFTLLNMLLGFYAIILSMQGRYLDACIAIMIACFADGIDGWVARMTHTTSEFGVELDSLADLVSFCLAPALMLYMRWLSAYPKIGWLCAFVFVAAGAVRLARFNAYDVTSTSFFNGLPSPAAGGLAISLILIDVEIFPGESNVARIVPAAMWVLAYLMVSNIRFISLKKYQEGRMRYSAVIGVLLFIFVMLAHPFRAFAAAAFVYLLASLLGHLVSLRKQRPGESDSGEEAA